MAEQHNADQTRTPPTDVLVTLVLPSIVLLMNVEYFSVAFLDVRAGFGFSQLGRTDLTFIASIWAIVGALHYLSRAGLLTRVDSLWRNVPRVALPRNAVYATVSVTASLLFFALRTNLVNPDGAAFQAKFETDVPVHGAFLTHDEMLEFVVHSKFWQVTHAWFGWSVKHSYQVVSSAAGAGFVFTLLKFADVAVPSRRGLYCLLVASGGFMQLFFGDVENYTLVNTCLLIYILYAHQFLEGRTRLVVPAITMAIAMSFHLLAGWLLPSLLVLGAYSLKTRPVREFWTAVGAFFAVLVAVMCFVKVMYDLPFSALYYGSHAMGNGGSQEGHLFGRSAYYYVEIVNLVFLLFPGIPVLIALLVSRRIRWEPFNIFLAVMGVSALFFALVWRAQLGVLNDWNLFAVVGLVLSVFCWRVCLQDERIERNPRVLALMAVTFGLHTYSWIAFNHSFGLRG